VDISGATFTHDEMAIDTCPFCGEEVTSFPHHVMDCDNRPAEATPDPEN
jgi:hypothetical protein